MRIWNHMSVTWQRLKLVYVFKSLYVKPHLIGCSCHEGFVSIQSWLGSVPSMFHTETRIYVHSCHTQSLVDTGARMNVIQQTDPQGHSSNLPSTLDDPEALESRTWGSLISHIFDTAWQTGQHRQGLYSSTLKKSCDQGSRCYKHYHQPREENYGKFPIFICS